LTSLPEAKVLEAMAGGWTLKAHRYLDGGKEYRLHALDGASEIVAPETVQSLAEQGLIDSNKKFPAATFWLTEKGRSVTWADN
jgi:hypothetical protein